MFEKLSKRMMSKTLAKIQFFCSKGTVPVHLRTVISRPACLGENAPAHHVAEPLCQLVRCVRDAGFDESFAQCRGTVGQHADDELAHVLRERGQRHVAETVVGLCGGCGGCACWRLFDGEFDVEIGGNVPHPEQRAAFVSEQKGTVGPNLISEINGGPVRR
jgi:hypothetical protein